MLLLLTAEQAKGQDAVRLCREKGTDDDVRPIPQSLVPAAKRIFGLRMPDQQVLDSTVFRCADGHALLCTYGANLPGGKANSNRDLVASQVRRRLAAGEQAGFELPVPLAAASL